MAPFARAQQSSTEDKDQSKYFDIACMEQKMLTLILKTTPV